MVTVPVAKPLHVAASQLNHANHTLQSLVEAEPLDAFDLRGDTGIAQVVKTVPAGGSRDGLSWQASARIYGHSADAGVSVWITEDTGHVGDRLSGPNHWLVHFLFTDRTSSHLRAATAAAQAAEVALQHSLVAHTATLDAHAVIAAGVMSMSARPSMTVRRDLSTTSRPMYRRCSAH